MFTIVCLKFRFGEAVSSPLTIGGASGAGGHFTFNESDSGPTSGVIEDTHADLTNQIAPHLPITPGMLCLKLLGKK